MTDNLPGGKNCGSRQTHPVMTDDGDQGVRECETCAKQFATRGPVVPGTRFREDGSHITLGQEGVK